MSRKNRIQKPSVSYCYAKRGLDVLLSGSLLLFLWLPMVIIALAICADSRGGAIFRQMRVGRDGRLFVCYKFRTMYSNAPPDRATSEFFDACRYVTPVGRLLRKSSLDELPQLWNVLKGDMSLVGPRPLIPKEQTMHAWRSRCGVYRIRPGMTGLAQIRGRDSLPDADKARLDARYVRSMNFRTDLRIVGRTLLCVCTARGVACHSTAREIQKR